MQDHKTHPWGLAIRNRALLATSELLYVLAPPLQTPSTVAHWAQWNVYQPPFRSLPASFFMETARTSVPGLCSHGFSHSACFLLGLVGHLHTCPLVCDGRRKLLHGSPHGTSTRCSASTRWWGVLKMERCLTLPSRAALTWRGNRNMNSYLTCIFSLPAHRHS